MSRGRAAVIVVLSAFVVAACSATERTPSAPVAKSPAPEVLPAPPPVPAAVSATELASDLDHAQDAATKIDDPVRRKDALVKVLADKEKFIEEYKGSDAAESTRNGLPDLYNLIVETIATAIYDEKDLNAVVALLSADAAAFEDVRKAIRNRIAELKAIEKRTEDDENKLMAARYNYPHTLYFHSLLFPAGSKERTDLCNAALMEFDEFDLDYGGGDNPSILTFYAYLDCGLCLKETGRPDEAIKMFDRTIALRESWGPADEKTGVWPIPADAQDVVDLVSYATLQKAIVLRETK